jgi:hypothetical protein
VIAAAVALDSSTTDEELAAQMVALLPAWLTAD